MTLVLVLFGFFVLIKSLWVRRRLTSLRGQLALRLIVHVLIREGLDQQVIRLTCLRRIMSLGRLCGGVELVLYSNVLNLRDVLNMLQVVVNSGDRTGVRGLVAGILVKRHVRVMLHLMLMVAEFLLRGFD